jgi:hypothetical protein
MRHTPTSNGRGTGDAGNLLPLPGEGMEDAGTLPTLPGGGDDAGTPPTSWRNVCVMQTPFPLFQEERTRAADILLTSRGEQCRGTQSTILFTPKEGREGGGEPGHTLLFPLEGRGEGYIGAISYILATMVTVRLRGPIHGTDIGKDDEQVVPL